MNRIYRYVLVPALIGALVGAAIVLLMPDQDPPGAAPPALASSGFADAVARAAPAVVNIYSSKRLPPSQHPICQMPRFRDMCDALQGGRGNVQSSLGSGVVVRAGGYVLTNHHVIRDADEIRVHFTTGEQREARLVGSDPETDLAVIKVDATDLIAISVAAPGSFRVGDIALAIGNPFGIGQTVSLGIVSATGRYGVSDSPYSDFIQTDAAVHPGNSGGALIDTAGNLIGINSLIFSRSGASESIGFAIPADLAFDVMDQIVELGYVRRGWLGIELEPYPPPGIEAGLAVRLVIGGSPAARAGLEPGDRIVAVDAVPATSSTLVIRQVAMSEPGSRIQVELLRRGSRLTLDVRAGLRPRIGD